MLKIKKIVNFGWGHKYYPGQLVAAHMSDCPVPNRPCHHHPREGVGVVRVVNRLTDYRILI